MIFILLLCYPGRYRVGLWKLSRSSLAPRIFGMFLMCFKKFQRVDSFGQCKKYDSRTGRYHREFAPSPANICVLGLCGGNQEKWGGHCRHKGRTCRIIYTFLVLLGFGNDYFGEYMLGKDYERDQSV